MVANGCYMVIRYVPFRVTKRIVLPRERARFVVQNITFCQTSKIKFYVLPSFCTLWIKLILFVKCFTHRKAMGDTSAHAGIISRREVSK